MKKENYLKNIRTLNKPDKKYGQVVSGYFWYHIKQVIVLLLLTGYLPAYAQMDANYEWAKAMGGWEADEGRSVAVDGSGNVYVTGYFTGTADFNPGGSGGSFTASGNKDIFLIKYAPDSTFLWGKKLGGTSADEGRGVAVDGSGNVYVTGLFGSATAEFNPGGSGGSLTRAGTSGNDAFLAKYAPDGTFLWAKGMGGTSSEEGRGIAADASGNVYVTGTFSGTADFNPGGSGGSRVAANTDVFLVKYNTSGVFQWVRGLGGSSVEEGNSVAVDGSGNVYIAGHFNSTTANFNPGGSGGSLTRIGGYDVFIAKYASDSTMLWAKNMGSSSADYCYGVASDVSGNVYVTGYFASASFDPGGGPLTRVGTYEIYLAAYTSDGTFRWARSIGGSGTNEYHIAYGVATDASGNVYITGTFSATADLNRGGSDGTITSTGGNPDSYNIFVAKYAADNTFLWVKRAEIPHNWAFDESRYLAVDPTGKVYVTGYIQGGADFNPGGIGGARTSAGGKDVFLLKLSQGCEVFTSFVESECDSFVFNGVTYTTTGVYRDTFTTAASCDSIVTLDLTITGYSSNNPVISGHYCDSVTFNGVTYDSTGVYVQNYTNTSGCDSSVTYDLTIGKNSPAGSLSITACGNFAFNDTVYTASGIHFVTFVNADNCDSSIVLNLTINSTPVATITENEGVLTAGSADSYQWLDCADNSVISGATGQSHTPTEAGSYAVIITDNGCSDTSDCVQAGTGVSELGIGNKVQLYPNPAGSFVTIQAARSLSNATIRLVNMVGQPVALYTGQHGASCTLDMNRYAPGVYFVEISEGVRKIRMKMVKE